MIPRLVLAPDGVDFLVTATALDRGTPMTLACLLVTARSTEPGLRRGDVVLVDRQPAPALGAWVAALDHGRGLVACGPLADRGAGPVVAAAGLGDVPVGAGGAVLLGVVTLRLRRPGAAWPAGAAGPARAGVAGRP